MKNDGTLQLIPPIFEGKRKLITPILGLSYDRQCSVIAQPIIAKYSKTLREKYSTNEYINLLRLEDGKMKPIIQMGDNSPQLMTDHPIKVLSNYKFDIKEILFKIVRQTLVIQNELFRKVYLDKAGGKEFIRVMSFTKKMCIKFNSELFSTLKTE